MVKLTRIYTKGGDKGKTSLGDGTRVFKNSLRCKAIGDVDETNAVLGIVRLNAPSSFQNLLQHLQNDLFDIGADLCYPTAPNLKKGSSLQVTEHSISYLETTIDTLNSELEPLNSFVLPGGSLVSSYLHLARTVARRAERTCVDLSQEEYVNPLILKYINRLSDLLFVLSRFLNNKGTTDILWTPGKNQTTYQT